MPSSGSGTLARLGNVILLVGSTDPVVVSPLLAQAQQVAANGGQGRQLVRGFAFLLGNSAGDLPDFVALAPHATGLAVLVQGSAAVIANGERITGELSLAWAERLIPFPVSDIEAVVDASATPGGGLFRLSDGIVEAGGLLITTGVAGDLVQMVDDAAIEQPADDALDVSDVMPAEQDVSGNFPPPPPDDRPTPPVIEDRVGGFDSILLQDVDVDDVEPLPVVLDEGDVHDHGSEAEEVRGVYCKNRHFNDPRQLFCGICGINMVQQTPVLVNGKRPPLGVMVLADGAVFQLDSDYLLGRDPGLDDRVRSGAARAVPVQDTSNQISRVHARLELRGWDAVLIDNASTNGTFFNPPETPEWQRLPSGGSHVLAHGTRVRIGDCMLTFNIYSGA